MLDGSAGCPFQEQLTGLHESHRLITDIMARIGTLPFGIDNPE